MHLFLNFYRFAIIQTVFTEPEKNITIPKTWQKVPKQHGWKYYTEIIDLKTGFQTIPAHVGTTNYIQ